MSRSSYPFSRALVTGGAGFIGSHLSERLIELGVEVTILDNFSSGFETNVPKSAKVVRADVRDKDGVHKACNQIDVIFHLAEYIPNIVGHVIKFSSENPREDLDVCVGGTLNLLEEARQNDTHFVLASTAAVYGSAAVAFAEDSVLQPLSSYGVAKLSAELYTQQFHRSYGMPFTILRFFNVFGPRQRKYLMYDCLAKLKRDPTKLELIGTGEEVRDFIFINDAVDQIIALPTLSRREESPIFNVGTGEGRTTKDVVGKLIELRQINPKIAFAGNKWIGNSNCLIAETKKTKHYFKGTMVPFNDSLASLIRWFDRNV